MLSRPMSENTSSARDVGRWFPLLKDSLRLLRGPRMLCTPKLHAPRSLMPHRATWAIVAVLTFALIAFALIWSDFGNKSTVDSTKPPGLGKVAQNASDAATSNARKASGEFEAADLDPDPSSVLHGAGTDVAPRLEPEPRPKVYHSLPTGARFCRGKIPSPGEGVLTVENGTGEDAVLRLYDVATEQTIRCLFVKANESVRITGISEGTYGLKYTTGLDWQDNMETFHWRPLYSRFEKTVPVLGRSAFPYVSHCPDLALISSEPLERDLCEASRLDSLTVVSSTCSDCCPTRCYLRSRLSECRPKSSPVVNCKGKENQ